jgi:hypothetical protein
VQTSRISFISGRHQVVCRGRIIDLLLPVPRALSLAPSGRLLHSTGRPEAVSPSGHLNVSAPATPQSVVSVCRPGKSWQRPDLYACRIRSSRFEPEKEKLHLWSPSTLKLFLQGQLEAALAFWPGWINKFPVAALLQQLKWTRVAEYLAADRFLTATPAASFGNDASARRISLSVAAAS